MRRRVLARGLGALSVAACFASASPALAGAATLTVDTTDEFSTTDCSLNEAITSANIDSNFSSGCIASGTYGDDTINVTATGTLNLSGPLTPITSHLDIVGPGASQFDIHRDSGGNYRVIQVNNTADASISGVTISNGRINTFSQSGAGIGNFGTLELDGVVVRDNQLVDMEDAVNPAPGGAGIANGGTLTVRRSTIRDNTVDVTQSAPTGQTSADALGGGFYNSGTLTVERSTISGNTVTANVLSDSVNSSAFGGGGAVYNVGGTALIKLSTLSENQSIANATAGFETTRGGAIYNVGNSLTVSSSTIAANNAEFSSSISAQGIETVTNSILNGTDPNCDGSINTDGGFNLEFPASCAGLTGALHSDPQLQVLADYGGPTQTMALGATSPALDAGTDQGEALDQRGLARTFDFTTITDADDGTDIGALEARDEDGDGRNDDADDCPLLAGGGSESGCPIAEGTLTLKYSKRKQRFKGRLTTTGAGGCVENRDVEIFRKRHGSGESVGTAPTDPDGKYRLNRHAKSGKRYYASTTRVIRGGVADCSFATSPTIKVR